MKPQMIHFWKNSTQTKPSKCCTFMSSSLGGNGQKLKQKYYRRNIFKPILYPILYWTKTA